MLPDRNDRHNRVCPVERAGVLDHRIRRWLQDPQKILRPYVEEGMTVLDIGCGPGFRDRANFVPVYRFYFSPPSPMGSFVS